MEETLRERFERAIETYDIYKCIQDNKGLIDFYYDLMEQAYNMALPQWVSVAMKQPEIGQEIWVWAIDSNYEMIVNYESEDMLKYFKHWRPVVYLGNPN